MYKSDKWLRAESKECNIYGFVIVYKFIDKQQIGYSDE